MTTKQPQPWLPGTRVEVIIATPTAPNGSPTIYEGTVVDGTHAFDDNWPKILVAIHPEDRRWVDTDSVRRVES